jgi:hypothetical protein
MSAQQLTDPIDSLSANATKPNAVVGIAMNR